MQTSAEIMERFIRKATIDNTVKDLQIVAGPEGLSTKSKDPAAIMLVKASLNKKVFTDYKIGTINVRSTDMLLKALRALRGSTIQIDWSENRLKLQNDKVSFDLVQSENIDSLYAKDVPPFEYGHVIIAPSKTMKQPAELLGVIKSSFVRFDLQGKTLVLTVGEETDQASVRLQTDVEKDITGEYNSDYYSAIVNVIDADKVKLQLAGSKYPMRLQEDSEDMTVEVMLAPIVKNDGEE